jgi:hypothetical protein
MKKLLIIALLPLGLGAVERLSKKPFHQMFAPDFELNIVNASKSYGIEVTTQNGNTEKILPGRRSGTLEVPFTTDDDKAQIKLKLRAYDKSGIVDSKDYVISYNKELGTPIKSEAPTIIIDYSKGWFGNKGFTITGNHLFTGFDASAINDEKSKQADFARYSML